MGISGYGYGAGNWNGQSESPPKIPQTEGSAMAIEEGKNIFWELITAGWPMSAGATMVGKDGKIEFISNGKEWLPYDPMRFPEPSEMGEGEPGPSRGGDGSGSEQDASGSSGQASGRGRSGRGRPGRYGGSGDPLPDGDRGFKDITSKYGESYRRFDDFDGGPETPSGSGKAPGPSRSERKKAGKDLEKAFREAFEKTFGNEEKKGNKTPGRQAFDTKRTIFIQLRGVQFSLDVQCDEANMLPEELEYPACIEGEGVQYGYLATGTTLVRKQPKDRDPRKFRLKSFTEEKYGTMAIYREIKPEAGWK